MKVKVPSTSSMRKTKPVVFSKRQLEFVCDWIDFFEGRMDSKTFYGKWLTKSEGRTIVDDLVKAASGEDVDLDKWSKGKYTGYVRQLYAEVRRRYEKALKELLLAKKFLELPPPHSLAAKYVEEEVYECLE